METLAVLILLCVLSPIATVADTITPARPLKDGETMVSAGRIFELGFFSPLNSEARYLGIWYKKVGPDTVVWVANRDAALNDTTGVLSLSGGGILSIASNASEAVWFSTTEKLKISPVAQILDTGNLVVRDESDEKGDNILWQSFDYPGNTLLPGMKYGVDLRTGLNRGLRSWKTHDDPSSGNYTNIMDPNGVPEFYLKRGTDIQFRSGPWNGERYSGMPNLKPNQIYTYEFVLGDEEVYYSYHLRNRSVLSRLVLNTNGNLERYTWIDRTREWNLYLTAQMDDCDRYKLCGIYGTCNINNSPACGCLEGFVPISPEDWGSGDWSQGCVRKTRLNCSSSEGFRRYSALKLPDTGQSWYNKTMDLNACEHRCLANCSCTAYSSLDVRNGGSGCILWFGPLIDIRQYAASGQDIYIRMAKSDLEELRSSDGKKLIRIVAPPVVVGVAVLIGAFVLWHILRKKKKNKKKKKQRPSREGNSVHNREMESTHESQDDDLDLPLFGLGLIAEATENFSPDNKLGQGGFGIVYKGKLEGGREIAVKRLSKNSRQGLGEFKNEVFCIAKLQHRNLVRLLGCCIEAGERMLIYEYLPNKSLNFFIFDENQGRLLNWSKRFHIINGIARGLLYLHQDSRLRIVHRDLKASNILLDHEMNPKISDFGMARRFGGDEIEANTTRVVGTYGYMSPEYTIDGIFSLKSDVFSFGVLVLEILSGKKNRGFRHKHHRLNLLGHAWMLHKDGDPLELVDCSLRESCNPSEVLRSIHVALLCVQRSPEDRPSMSTTVLLLTSDIALPEPKEPGFFTERNFSDSDTTSTVPQKSTTFNRITITMLDAR